MSSGKFRLVAAFAVGSLGSSISARAGFIFQLTQSGTNVTATGSGTLNLSALTSIGSTSDPAFIAPILGALSGGPTTSSADTFYSGLTGPTDFGSGGSANATAGAGSEVLIAGVYQELAVPAGYVSGSLLSDSATFYGTFLSLGITPGTYTWNWGSGASADSLTLVATPVPEPTVLCLTCVSSMLILLGRRRRLMGAGSQPALI